MLLHKNITDLRARKPLIGCGWPFGKMPKGLCEKTDFIPECSLHCLQYLFGSQGPSILNPTPPKVVKAAPRANFNKMGLLQTTWAGCSDLQVTDTAGRDIYIGSFNFLFAPYEVSKFHFKWHTQNEVTH